MLKRHLPDYEKSIDFDQVRDSYDAAVERARQLHRSAEHHGSPGRNPTTGVYLLTESILNRGSGSAF